MEGKQMTNLLGRGDDATVVHTINGNGTVAVATDYFWQPIDADTPKGVKLQLLGKGGVAVYGTWNGKDPFYTHWAPVPKRRPE